MYITLELIDYIAVNSKATVKVHNTINGLLIDDSFVEPYIIGDNEHSVKTFSDAILIAFTSLIMKDNETCRELHGESDTFVISNKIIYRNVCIPLFGYSNGDVYSLNESHLFLINRFINDLKHKRIEYDECNSVTKMINKPKVIIGNVTNDEILRSAESLLKHIVKHKEVIVIE